MDVAIVIGWTGFAMWAAPVSWSRGQSALVGGVIGLFLGPIGVTICYLMSTDHEELDRRRLISRFFKRCPRCAEVVRAQALKCPHCLTELAELHGPEERPRTNRPLQPTPAEPERMPAPRLVIPKPDA